MSDSMKKNLEEEREAKTDKSVLSSFTEDLGKQYNKYKGDSTGIKGAIKGTFGVFGHPMESAMNATKGAGKVIVNVADKASGGRVSEQLEGLERATTPTTEASQKAALKSLNEKKPQTLDYDTSINESKAKESINQFKEEANKTAERQVSNLDIAAQNIDKMDESSAAQNASDLANEITQHDITTEEGRQNIQEYLDTYEQMLSGKYDDWTSNYNRALMFTALSQGLSSAFGLGSGVDFTQHPSVTAAKEQLDDMRRILSDEKATAGRLSQQKLDQELEDRAKRTQHQQEVEAAKAKTKNEAESLALSEAQKLVDGDIDTSNADKAAKAIAEVQLANNQATLKQGLDNAEARIEEGKVQNAGAESLSSGVGFEAAKAAGEVGKDVVKEGVKSMFPKLF